VSLLLAPWATRRRQDLLELLDRLDPNIKELTAAVEQEAKKPPEALRLMTLPGVGPLTALAFLLIKKSLTEPTLLEMSGNPQYLPNLSKVRSKSRASG